MKNRGTGGSKAHDSDGEDNGAEIHPDDDNNGKVVAQLS